MKIHELEMEDYQNLMQEWLWDKYSIDGWGDYYNIKREEGWPDDKIYEEFEKLYLEFEEDVKNIDFEVM